MAQQIGVPVTTRPVLSPGKMPVAQPPSRQARAVNLIKGPVGGSTISTTPAHTSTVPNRPGAEPPPSVVTPAPAARRR